MKKEVVIVGGGVIGLSTAYYAAEYGHAVTVIDRGGPIQDGASFGNMGMIVPSHFVPLAAPGMVALGLRWMWNPASPFYIKPRFNFELWDWAAKFWRASTSKHVRQSAPLLRDLHLASRACFEQLAAANDDFGLVKKGLLILCKTEHALDEEAKTAAHGQELGIPSQILDRRHTQELDPKVRMDVAGSVYFPKDCHLSPSRFMSSLKQRLDGMGVRFSWQTEATGWKTDRHRIQAIETSRGLVRGDEFALCGGSWSPLLARSLNLKLPLQAGKGYSLTLTQPRQRPEICAIFAEARVAVTPMGGSLRFGGTMEIAGLNQQIRPVRVQGIIQAIPKYYPDFTPQDFEKVSPWQGLRPCSPDGLPYLGRSRSFSNLTIATGHAMMGLSLGPISGKLAAEIISDQPASMDIHLLDPERYA